MYVGTTMQKTGYLLIDHRESPGLNPEEAHKSGLDGMPVGKGQVFEADVVLCNHCQAGVILNPLRTRDRHHCPKCNRYICDLCGAAMAATGVCLTIDKLFDYVQDANAGNKGKTIMPDLSPLYNTVKVSVPETPPKGE
jgi:hypothetical protein